MPERDGDELICDGCYGLIDKSISLETSLSSIFKEPFREPISSTNTNATSTIDCPTCKDEHRPDGAHKCIVCKMAVHALSQCSEPYGAEEGLGQVRICKKCVQS
ncbi:uncharacterized protein LOC118733792 [Rhagoletis pomonella]|uniref:uncharacterized protein LOC118733792 n=1 Tax=Rhagoletis pomonella TaxID=28610 RepID=UPI001786E75A|nr:uncharacterized protein LOC118733792 [Rhagoletis pomonella]